MCSTDLPALGDRGDALLSFASISRPILFKGSAELLPNLGAVLRGWRIDRLASSPEADPVIVVERTAEGYRRTSRWLANAATFADPVDAVCDFLVDLVKAFVAANPGLLCLHCAAAQYDDGLVLFPSTYKAGKSVLAASLAASGVRLFSDDVLPVISGTSLGMAPGILPRLRLPVPDGAAPGLAEFAERREGLRGARYVYLDPGPAMLARLGETAPIRGMVLLDRDPARPPKMTSAGTDEVLCNAVLRSFGDNFSGIETLDRLHQIVGGAACYRLSYSAAEQAVTMLGDVFGHGPQRLAVSHG